MKKSNVSYKFIENVNNSYKYKIILDEFYEKDIIVTERDCTVLRGHHSDVIHLKIIEEMRKLGISDDKINIVEN